MRYFKICFGTEFSDDDDDDVDDVDDNDDEANKISKESLVKEDIHEDAPAFSSASVTRKKASEHFAVNAIAAGNLTFENIYENIIAC